jgi:hypothetical protein
VWLLSDTQLTTRRDVAGLFNWDDHEKEFDISLKRLGLDPAREYVGFDFWRNEVVPSIKRNLKIRVPAQSCAVLALRPSAGHPQLLSTSRHVTQGIIDVTEESWNVRRGELSGRSKVVANDPYELRVWSSQPAQAITVRSITGEKMEASFRQDGNLIRATINSPKSNEVGWTIRFK